MNPPGVLLVCPPEVRSRFPIRQPAIDAARVVSCETCFEARRALQIDPSIALVITALSLADGNWYSVLESSVASGDRAEVVVAAENAGERLRELVRAHGGWDVVEDGVDLAALLAAIQQKQRGALRSA